MVIYKMERSLFCRTHKPWFAKRDAVHSLHMAFEMLQVFEYKPLRLTRWVTTLYFGLWIFSFKVIAFNMIHHLRRAAIGTHPFFVAPRFVSNTEQALSLATDEGQEREVQPQETLP
jgi:hypothetical protein